MDVYTSATDTTPTTYYYVLNLQGDVIQLRNSSDNLVANYAYDAWGKVLSVTNSSGTSITSSTNIANVNPLRYRGYFYDSETKFYYCNSRYYDPAMRRFINADAYMSTGQGFGGFNMFAYCQNNPVMYCDPSGNIVTSWDLAHCTSDEIEVLLDCTRVWHSTNNLLLRAAVQSTAASIRCKYLSSGEYLAENGRVYNSNGDEFHFILYDNDRFVDNTPFHEQIIAISGGGAQFEPSKFMFSGGFINADLFTGGWEYKYIDISLLDVGHMSAEATLSPTGLSVGASASVWSPSVSVSLFGVKFEIGAEILAIGAGVSFSDKGLKGTASFLGGISFSIQWN